ncbi:zinc finger protein 653-like [Pristis pectinata]|uniref:zinc finger protein 653-like n=1 Tax=Pristis pectinata TaxID=685728 RepID=UPI00223E3FE6|nr:zinc finger protein 653-like [Pristis pectinata]XP_051897834.1 zinc finger protein 653-like [Pristis pectinata]
MAEGAESAAGPEAEAEGTGAGPGGAGTKAAKRGRGRPRLSDSDRLRQRVNSRKKYDNRRIYIGESFAVWAALRERYGWSDKRLAEHLVQLEQRRSKSGAEEQNSKINSSQKVRKQAITSLKTLVTWYEQHKQMCKQEPLLYELQQVCDCSVAVVWQCEAGHQYLQHMEPVQNICHSTAAEPTAKGNVTISSSKENMNRQQCPVEKKESKAKRDAIRKKPGQSNELYMKCESDTSTCDESDSDQKFKEYFNVKLIDVDASEPNYEGGSKENGKTQALSSVGKPSKGEDKDKDQHRTAIHEPASLCRAQSPCKSSVTEGSQPSLPAELPALNTIVQTVEKDALYSLTTNCPVTVQISTVQSSEITSITEEFGQVPLDTAQQVNPTEYEEMTCTFSEQLTYVNPVGECYTIEEQNEATEWNEHPDVIGERTVIDGSGLRPAEPGENAQDVPHKPKRKKRGHVIDADGMFQLFHCPHEGCNQVYITLNSFQNHVNLVHRKGKTKVCSHPGCGKRFYLSNHLRRHMIIHSGVRDFICETCGKSFKRKNHLEVHRRTHTGETPLQCEICGYQCRQRASLNWHMKKHNTEIQYNFTCEYCGKKFEKMDSVKFHKLKSHPECQTM